MTTGLYANFGYIPRQIERLSGIVFPPWYSRFYTPTLISTGRQLYLSRYRESEMEGCAFARLALNPDLSAMPKHSQAAKCQADSKSTCLVGAAQTCELIEDALLLRGGNSGAVILHPHMHPIALMPGTYPEL